MFLHLLSDDQRGAFATTAGIVARVCAGDGPDQARVDRALPDPALYRSPVARNVFLLELTRIVMDEERPSPCAAEFLDRCATVLEVPTDRTERFKRFAAPPASLGSAVHRRRERSPGGRPAAGVV